MVWPEEERLKSRVPADSSNAVSGPNSSAGDPCSFRVPFTSSVPSSSAPAEPSSDPSVAMDSVSVAVYVELEEMVKLSKWSEPPAPEMVPEEPSNVTVPSPALNVPLFVKLPEKVLLPLNVIELPEPLSTLPDTDRDPPVWLNVPSLSRFDPMEKIPESGNVNSPSLSTVVLTVKSPDPVNFRMPGLPLPSPSGFSTRFPSRVRELSKGPGPLEPDPS